MAASPPAPTQAATSTPPRRAATTNPPKISAATITAAPEATGAAPKRESLPTAAHYNDASMSPALPGG